MMTDEMQDDVRSRRQIKDNDEGNGRLVPAVRGTRGRNVEWK